MTRPWTPGVCHALGVSRTTGPRCPSPSPARPAADRPGEAVIGGRRPLTGRKVGDRRVRVERPHAPYFRYAGPGQLVAREAASIPRTPTGRALARLRGVVFGRPLANAAGDRGTPVQAQGARDLQLGCHLVVRLRDRGDPSRSRCRRRGRDAAVDRARRGDRHPARRRVALIPAGVPCLPERRRRVRRRAHQPRADLRPHRRGRPPDRLRDDRGGVDRGGDRTDPVGHPRRVRLSDRRSRSRRSRSSRSPTCAGCESRATSSRSRPICSWHSPSRSSRSAPCGSCRDRGPSRHAPTSCPFGTEALSIFLLLKAFAGGSVALTGVEAIANGVPAFKPPEAKNAANTMSDDGRPARRPIHRIDGRSPSPSDCARPRRAVRP